MSFLLDALRKSEQSGRRPSAPTIHSASPSGSVQNAGRGEDWLPTLAFTAPAFLLMCWFGLSMFEVGPFGPEDSPRVVQPAVQTGQVPSDSDPGVTGAKAAPEASSRNSAPQFVGSGTAEKQQARTPVERLQEDPVPESQPDAPREDPLEAASRAIEQAMADSGPKPTDTQQPKPVQQPVQKPVAEPRSPPAQAQPGPERQNHIDYWELPNNVRTQLPEFRISVTVYDEQPEKRFILINGRRLYEGEELQPDLVLSEVRREGPVFSFRRYRFIVTR